jgi:porin
MKRWIAVLAMGFACAGVCTADESADESSALTAEFYYIGENFANLSGGIRKGQRYRGDVALSLSLDTEKAGLWKGGSFSLTFENAHGAGITERFVGDLQFISSIDAGQFTQVSEYYIGQSLMDDWMHLKIGKQDANLDFNITDAALEFINSSFTLMPNVPIPTFPNPSLGVSGDVSLADFFTLRAGIYDCKGRGGTWGFSTAFGPDPESVEVGEMEFAYGKGLIKLGAWRHGGKCPSLRGTRAISANYGGYGILEGSILGTVKEEDAPCLSAFLQFSAAPGEFNEIKNYLGAGMRASGYIPRRGDDSMGIGMARAIMSDDLPGLKDETALEAYYLAPFFDAVTIQPDVQYIVNPGGTEKNAFVAGVRFGLEF